MAEPDFERTHAERTADCDTHPNCLRITCPDCDVDRHYAIPEPIDLAAAFRDSVPLPRPADAPDRTPRLDPPVR